MLLPHYSLNRLREPVSIYSSLYVTQTQRIVHIQFLLCKRVGRFIFTCKTFCFQLLGSVHQIIVAQVGSLYKTVEFIAYAQTSLFWSFSSNNYHTVGSTRSVNSGSRRVFQNSYAGYTVHIQVVYFFCCYFITIQNESRLVRVVLKVCFRDRAETRVATNTHLRNRIRV